MRTVTITKNVYSIEDVKNNQELKKLVLNNLYDINVNYNWWTYTYEDAERIGLKITGFDLDRGANVSGKLLYNGDDVANRIIKEHVKECETYKLAQRYILDLQAIEDAHNIDEDDDQRQDDITDLESTFLKDLCKLYLIILINEYDYLTSEEAIMETIEANEYEFTEDGKIF